MFEFRTSTDEDMDKILNLKSKNDYSCYDLDKNNINLDRLLERTSCDFFSVLNNDEVIGFIESYFDEDDNLDMGCALLPEFLGKGLGFDFITECVEFIIDYFQFSGEEVYTILSKCDEHSIGMFEKVGFNLVDESEEWVKLSIYML